MITLSASEIDFALIAVQQAALLAAEIQEELVSSAITKEDRSPVTVADFAAQAVVGYYLERRFPEARLVGEENAAVLRDSAQKKTLQRVTEFVSRVIPGVTAEQVIELIDRGSDAAGEEYWTLDPIDGTKGFLRRAQYATALAFVRGSEVEVGVLGCPGLNPFPGENSASAGALLAASRGEGSWMTSLQSPPPAQQFRRLTVSSREDTREARLLRSFESGHTNISQIDSFQEALNSTADPVRLDSQVKYALLADGQGEIYLRLLSADRPDYQEKIWDQAAGSLLVQEAGGMVTDLDGRELDFSQGRTLAKNRGVCATNGRLHQAALEALKEINA